jgi:uncharacterized protein (TIGR02266 family)
MSLARGESVTAAPERVNSEPIEAERFWNSLERVAIDFARRMGCDVEMSDGRRHFRGKPRPGRRVEVRYQVVEHETAGPEQVAFTLNIGVGGAFIVTTDPPSPGAILTLALTVPPGERKIPVKADVRWIADGDDDPVHGMGVRFHGLDVEQLHVLNEYFASLPAMLDHDELA